jgi:nicotinamide mononucleotide (NMN) deamidase PncC
LVEPIHAESCDCVSEKVADEMAINVCKLFTSDWGIGITGYAVPVAESGKKIFAHYSIACNNKIVLQKKIIAKKEEPLRVQLFFVNTVLKDFSILLRKKQMAHT